ncbi:MULTISPECIES: glycosyltransferase [Brevibacterium]|uniref:D-inositol 3-phosphate glycosyltransferase n=1 Tax=Brevibacterium casei TaxID=33889 RepID=A0A7T4A138_9MICO|nr:MULTISPECIES: glycosyltransferase [Brevibacterium]QQB15393.1 glycosyltransferase [Brevibacterium casei]
MRILVIADYRYPLREPLRGGLETHVWTLVRELERRGHHVTLAAKSGSDFLENSPPELIYDDLAWPPGARRSDSSLPREIEDHQRASLEAVIDYLAAHPTQFDVVHNHAVSALPLSRAAALDVPVFTTLHTPPRLDLVNTIDPAQRGRVFTVSGYAQESWANAGVDTTVVMNGADATVWPLGPGGDRLCWFGRLVPEKYPHVAVDVANRLGARLTLMGPVGDPDYFADYVAPAIARSHGRVDYLGCLSQRETAHIVGGSAATLVTPMWNEPFGQVVIESLFCGTPVVALDRGAFGKLYRSVPGVTLVPTAMSDDEQLAAMASAAHDGLRAGGERAGIAARRRLRDYAVSHFSVSSVADTLLGHFAAAIRDPERFGTVWEGRAPVDEDAVAATTYARTGAAG